MQSLQRRLENLQESMFNSIGNYYIKSLVGEYICCNANQMQHVEASNICELLGKTDAQTKWAEIAPMLRRNDNFVTYRKSCITRLEIGGNTKGDLVVYASRKQPFYHDGELIGVQGLSLEVPFALVNNAKHFDEHTLFIDLEEGKYLNISPSERRTLFYVLQGFTAKQIAAQVVLSPRTIEHQILSIRVKNNYSHVRELVRRVRAI